jgi:uncharacterized protein DUF1570
MPSLRPRFLVAVLLSLLAAPAAADRLITNDGRILEVKKARKLDSGDYQLVFESGELTCPAKFVASVEIEGDMSDYVPANEDEKKKLADGFVRFRGKWLTKSAYTAELKKQADITKARTAELAAHANFYDGWKKDTKHFEIQSNTSPEILDYYAELLETYYDLMDQRVGIDPSPMLKKTKMKVSIYKNRPEFRELTKVDPGVAGFFNFVDGELHFYHDYQDPSVSEWVALHEGTHLLTFLIEPQARPWIWVNEGVADYFGAASIARNKKGKLEIQPGQLSLERILTVQQAMTDGSFVPLEKLFFLAQGDEFRAFEYAHSWSFVYFLNNAKPEYEKAFKKFFKELYTLGKGVAFDVQLGGGNKFGSWKVVQPAEVRRLLLEKLGKKDLVALEEEWKAYITSIPIDAPRARFQRGLSAIHESGDAEKRGLDDIEAAIAAGIDDPRAYWARAILRLSVKGGRAESQADMAKAVELAPLDAGLHANLAQLSAGLTLRTPGLTLSFGDEAKLVDDDDALILAERHFALAAEIAPENELVRDSRKTFLDLLEKKTSKR